ncbi:phytoene desaturase family protein [Actinomycetospora cinnamomea]|uniref:Pyridine nucleotide-disulfide oxidoreductase domain-containing protein 2 n=1 Tax=Actinomycetospora cinnamomea TaxID=663609 RepID=A0A2U1F655_9PSEU|nr:NAD(P)/FAD-dependent oxidoreductase [Actinomycetospora cinnamomea]PVZ07648.1 phytoene dehydrogenase-like protein [Actinomycetospora cinnamomea]
MTRADALTTGTETADAVVVGAGHNGLVAANLLADQGWSVRVLEASDGPGGATRTEEITAPGYLSDLGSAFHPMGIASPVLQGLDLGSYGLEWSHPHEPLAHVTSDDRGVLLSRDVDVTAASVERFGAGDGDVWRRLADEWQRLADPLMHAFLGPFPPVKEAARTLRTLGGPDALRLARRMLLPAVRFGTEEFRGEGARLLIAGNALHTDLNVTQTASTAFGWLLSMLAQDVGFPVPAGGSGMIAESLAARLRARGGTVECDRPVTRVLVESGRATGVIDAAGGVVRARRAVLADVPAPLLLRDLVGIEHLPARLVDDLARFQWDDAILKVDWALSGPIPWTAPEPRAAGTVHLGGDIADLVDFGADLDAGRMPRNPFMLLGQMTLADPRRSPPGTESVWAYTHLPHDREHTDAELDEQVRRMTALIERHAPGFEGRVVARRVSRPRDLQAHDPSLVRGALMAGTAQLHQMLVFRPTPGLGRPDTPVDGLFFSGATAHPAGAVHGAPGANAARAALARAGRLGRVYAAGIRAGHRLVYGAADERGRVLAGR